ncbi:MAG: NADH-quinone oxidoreductase subunit J [Pirellulaceae bacterium]
MNLPPLLAFVDFHTFLFTLFALVACVFAAGVVFTSNIVRMAFYLTVSLGATSGLFFLAGAEFVGAMQLMIYVGGTLVLLIFGVMLTAQDAFVSMKTRPSDWVLGVLVGGSLLVLLLFAAFTVPSWRPVEGWAEERAAIVADETQDTTRIGVALVGGRVDKQDESNAAVADGLSGYLLPFEIVSVHLLVVLIGAGYMARTKRRRSGVVPTTATPPTSASKQYVAVTTIVLALLWLGDVAGVVAGIVFVVAPPQALAEHLDSFPDWLLPVSIFLAALRGLCVLAIIFWQKWGFFGLAALSVAMPLVLAFSARGHEYLGVILGVAAGALIVNLIMVGIVHFLLTKVGRPTMWSQLD